MLFIEEVIITYECQNKCNFCKDIHDGKGHRSIEEIKKEIESIESKDLKVLLLSGGEPTLHPNLFEIIEYAKELNFGEITIKTNGLLFNDENFLNKFLKTNVNTVSLNYISSIEDEYNSISNSNNYNSFISAIEKIKKTKLKINLNHVLTNQNFKNLKKNVDFFNNKCNSFLTINLAQPNRHMKNPKKIVPFLLHHCNSWIKGIEQMHQDIDNIVCKKIPLCYLNPNPEKLGKSKTFISHRELSKNELDEVMTKKIFYLKSKNKKEQRNKFTKNISCSNCLFNSSCLGITKEYAKLYGTEFLMPKKSIIAPKVFGDKINTFISIEPFCNSKCLVCNQQMPPQLSCSHVKKERYMIKIDTLKNDNSTIFVTGGEPTLRKDLLYILRYINYRLKDKKIVLETNARFFSYKKQVKLLENISNLVISTYLWSDNESNHDNVTSCDNSFKQTYKAIKNFDELKINYNLKMMVNSYNCDDLENLAKFYYSEFKNYEKIIIFPINIEGNASDFGRDIDIIKFIDNIEKACEFMIDKNINFEIYDIPLCLIKNKFHKYIKENNRFKEDRKIYESVCKNCKLNSKCYKTWNLYYHNLGKDFLKPILK
jgi:MoaA/NifB/PqqE/SkfB family radical SAM enzyme